MNKTLVVVLSVIVVLILMVGGYFVGTYNRLVVLDQEVQTKQAQVEVVLQRRFDLIPNLVASTKGVLTQEQKVFGDIAEARTRYSGTTSGSAQRVEASNELESALSRLLVIVENYPQLKSDQTVQALMDELSGTENRIAVERGRYNESASSYNVQVRQFPTNLFAGMLGFSVRPLFEAQDGAQNAPSVNLQ